MRHVCRRANVSPVSITLLLFTSISKLLKNPSAIFDQYFIVIFRFCTILGVLKTNLLSYQDRTTGNNVSVWVKERALDVKRKAMQLMAAASFHQPTTRATWKLLKSGQKKRKKKYARHEGARFRLNETTFIRSERRERLNSGGTKREIAANKKVIEVRLFFEGRRLLNETQMLMP